jgi:hypothetical protein
VFVPNFARNQIFKIDTVFPSAQGIHTIRQKAVIGAHFPIIDIKIAMSFGQRVSIEHHLFRRISHQAATAINRVFQTFLITGVVGKAFQIVRNTEVFLRNTIDHFFIKGVL